MSNWTKPMPRDRQKVRDMIGTDLVDQVDKITSEFTAETAQTAAGVTLPGDSRRLRGLPAVGRGVSGHIAGTDPEQALLDKYDDDEEAA
jgi:hypothetical protein